MREDQLRDHFATYNTGEPLPSPEAIRRRGGRRRVAATSLAALPVAVVAAVLMVVPTVWPREPSLAVPEATPTLTRSASPSASPTASSSPTPKARPTRIEADPALNLRCRLLAADEWYVLNTAPISMASASPRAVDVGGGWAVVAYWNATGATRTLESRVIEGATGSAALPRSWDGKVPGSGVFLEDGPRANEAARGCLTAIEELADQPRPSLKCETPTRDELLRIQKAVWGGPDGNPTGGGAYVRGGMTPEGKPWRMFAVNTDTGAATVLWTRPSKFYKTGDPARDEYSPISPSWDGNLAEFRGHVQWGVEAREAAVACLAGSETTCPASNLRGSLRPPPGRMFSAPACRLVWSRPGTHGARHGRMRRRPPRASASAGDLHSVAVLRPFAHRSDGCADPHHDLHGADDQEHPRWAIDARDPRR